MIYIIPYVFIYVLKFLRAANNTYCLFYFDCASYKFVLILMFLINFACFTSCNGELSILRSTMELRIPHGFLSNLFWNCLKRYTWKMNVKNHIFSMQINFGTSSVYVNVFQHHLDILSDMSKQWLCGNLWPSAHVICHKPIVVKTWIWIWIWISCIPLFFYKWFTQLYKL